jgi:crotonobetainyl-CoA:carnitine CoA-transferase CaiB-like acyl-CoA transferase
MADVPESPGPPRAALEGVRVIEMATVVAAPAAARYLGDFGAEVTKIEAPAGDPARRMGWHGAEGPDSFFWKILGRNKQCLTIDLKSADGIQQARKLIDQADVLIENFRPGKLERLGLDPTDLLSRNPRLVILRISGFGQTGPYAHRPGFATIAEAMSGYAAISGEPNGGPLLPPIAITDELTGLAGAFAVMVALWHAERTGRGQVIDISLIETLIQFMGPLIPAYVHLGYLQPRLGSGLPWSVPRGTYLCADGRWVALSASADTVASRLLRAIGLDHDQRFATFAGRMQHREALERHVREWIGARSSDQVIQFLSESDTAIAPVYTMADVLADPHILARHTVIEVDGVMMPNVIARLSDTPGAVRHAGQPQRPWQPDELPERDADPPTPAGGPD